jgi:hypothetical protein
MLSQHFFLISIFPIGGIDRDQFDRFSSSLPQTRRGDYPVSLTPTSHSTGEMEGAGLLFSRRKLIACWQLSFCQMFYESFGNLGMLLLDEISPSKPFRPLSSLRSEIPNPKQYTMTKISNDRNKESFGHLVIR